MIFQHSGKRMVRIGEFSPLNPKLNSPGQALIGLGEYEERRKLLMEQRKHEYCQYLEEVSYYYIYNIISYHFP